MVMGNPGAVGDPHPPDGSGPAQGGGSCSSSSSCGASPSRADLEAAASSRSSCALLCCSFRAGQGTLVRLGPPGPHPGPVPRATPGHPLTFLLLHLAQVISTHQGHALWGAFSLGHAHLKLKVLLSVTEGQLLRGGQKPLRGGLGSKR